MNLIIRKTFTFMHLADVFIQSDLHCIQAIHFILPPGFYSIAI